MDQLGSRCSTIIRVLKARGKTESYKRQHQRTMIYVNIDINIIINVDIDIDDTTLSQTATLRLPRREPAQGGASSAETRKRLPTHPADQVHRHLTEKGKFCSGANSVGFVRVILSPKHCHFYCQVYGLRPNEH